ncbi:MAG: aminoacyl-histidine dipeptidase [Haliscomenobacter sp.]|nr:aminoacyl-histidine dipeptidase [Haliscomenobacter sp.]
MEANQSIRDLEPRALWNHFANLNDVPRGSKKETRVTEFIRKFGEKLGLPTLVDHAGNVIITKPGTPGKENHPVVVLQGHLDMVHEKNAGTEFDFDQDGIKSVIDGEWVKAEGTTLGADNGIGVAAIMTLLESADIPHPPLEALFTIDEETGMTGAKALQEGILTGKILLNLDSEEDDELTIGCAGGLDTFSEWQYKEDEAPVLHSAFQIKVSGLKGGHSGVDIHLGRANSNKILVRMLHKTQEGFGLRLASFAGGNLRNAIPREAEALVLVPHAIEKVYLEDFQQRVSAILNEFAFLEPDMKLEIFPTDTPMYVMAAPDQEKALSCLYAVPNGVYRMSPTIPGLVETSNNLAKVDIQKGVFSTQSLQRSSVESGKEDIAYAVRAALELAGAEVTQSGGYPGWAPDADSKILQVLVGTYDHLFGQKPKVAACHAGLECGIIGTHYPGMDMISFGPTIRHPHSPDEKVHIASVEKFWHYLTTILNRI